MLAAREGRLRRSCAGPEETKYGAVETAPKRSLRRPVQAPPRRDRRRHRHAAQFRRRARHRRHAAPGRPERARAGPGHARHARQDDHRATAATASAARCRPATTSSSTAFRTRSPRCTPKRPIPTSSPKIWTGSPRVCRVVRGLRSLRIGAIGARPAAFNTVRYSEKLLEASGISVEPIDLSEILGRIDRMKDTTMPRQAKLEAIQQVRLHRQRSRRSPDEDGQARRRDRQLDGADRSRHQRHPVLDLARRILRRGALHRHEHDEREPDVERLRSGYLRRRRHARPAARLAKRPAPCSTGTTTTATIPTRPSASIAATCPSTSSSP